jgi:hypothetical protein
MYQTFVQGLTNECVTNNPRKGFVMVVLVLTDSSNFMGIPLIYDLSAYGNIFF